MFPFTKLCARLFYQFLLRHAGKGERVNLGGVRVQKGACRTLQCCSCGAHVVYEQERLLFNGAACTQRKRLFGIVQAVCFS